jgi:hypothetical protein
MLPRPPVLEVLRSLARRSRTRPATQEKLQSMLIFEAPSAPRLGGLTLLGSPVLEPDLQTGKLQSMLILETASAPRLRELTLLGSPVLEPDLQPKV